MVARSNALFVLAPKSMLVVAIVGALTALFAASIGLVQNDIKRVLAYSTVSQLGYMFLALASEPSPLACSRLHSRILQGAAVPRSRIGHPCYERRAGHAQHGDLRERIPITYWTMLIATLAITGIPTLRRIRFQRRILWQTWTSEGGAYRVLWFVGYATALMTAFYMFRLVYLTFRGRPRMSHDVEHHIHESPTSMTLH